jgi:methylated-DNA-[protein]-cysteine S-methyltransferase
MRLAFDTAIGTCAIAWGEHGVTRVWLPGEGRAMKATAPVPPGVGDAIAGIVQLLDGEPVDLRGVELNDRGLSPFDRAVYAAARDIAPGTTASYGELARAIGAGVDGARAVGAALGRNPFPIIVPCHRVLAADGALHGFSAPGGIATKRRMLEIERAPGFTQTALFA